MKPLAALSLCFLACTARALDTDDLLDRVDTALSVAAFQDNVRLRLSGTIDLEGYHFQQPAPGLINSNIDNLFNPRLTLFLDAQVGKQRQPRIEKVVYITINESGRRLLKMISLKIDRAAQA